MCIPCCARKQCWRQGTLLRTACALGWDAAYMLPGCCDCFNDKAMRAGRGAAFRLPLAGGDWQGLQWVLEAHDLVPVAAHPHPEGKQMAGKLKNKCTYIKLSPSSCKLLR